MRELIWENIIYLEDYKAACEEEISDEVAYDNINDLLANEFDWIMDNNNFSDCVLIGSLGLWNGRFTAVRSIDNEAMRDIVADYDYVRFYKEGRRLFIELIHHDGTNDFEVLRLNSRGIERVANMEDRGDDPDAEILKDVEKFMRNYTKKFFKTGKEGLF